MGTGRLISAVVAVLAAGTIALSTGCTTTGGGSGGRFCDIAKPLRPTAAEADTLSPRTVNAILAHNETGAKLCGWTP